MAFKIINKKLFSAISVFSLFFTSCNFSVKSITHFNSNIDNRYENLKTISIDYGTEEKYNVLMITDVHCGSNFETDSAQKKLLTFLEELYLTAPEKMPKFCLDLGDMTNQGKNDEYQLYSYFVQKMEDYGIKVLNTVGNHDLYNKGWEDWKKHCYPYTSFYKFETKNFVWYGLDSASGTLGKKQYEALKKSLENETKIPVIFSHFPLEADESGLFAFRNISERALLIKLFSDKKTGLYLCGHYHPWYTYDFGTFNQICLESLGQYGKWYLLEVDEQSQKLKLVTY